MNEETDEAKWSPDEGVGIKILELYHTCAFKNMFTWGGIILKYNLTLFIQQEGQDSWGLLTFEHVYMGGIIFLKYNFNTIYTIRWSRWRRIAHLNFLEDHS